MKRAALQQPPDDADDWTDQQWIEWLVATDHEDRSESSPEPETTAGRIVHSTGGQLLGQTMMGVARAIYGRRADEVVIVMEASQPETDRAFDLHLDPDCPQNSYAVMRSPIGPAAP